MRKSIPFLILVGLMACDLSKDPVVVDDAQEFPVRAEWNATVAPIGSTVTGTTKVMERLGSQLDVQATLAGGRSNTAYQWRIFRGNCTATAAADLVLFGTIQAYPDLTTNSAGTATVTRLMAGALDSTANYSVRYRVATTATNWNGTSPVACGNLTRS